MTWREIQTELSKCSNEHLDQEAIISNCTYNSNGQTVATYIFKIFDIQEIYQLNESSNLEGFIELENVLI